MQVAERQIPLDFSVRSVSLTLIAAAAVMWILSWAQEVFIPIVVSILFSYALEPIVRALMRTRLPRLAASAVVVALVSGSMAYSAWSLADDAAAIVAQLPDAARELRLTLRRDGDAPGAIQQVQKAAEELQKTADEAAGPNPAPRGVQRVQIEEPTVNVREYLTWGSASVIAFGGQAVLVLFFVFFLLASGDLFKRKFVKIAGPSLEKKRVTVQILDEINHQIARFLLVRVVTSLVVAAATWVAFKLIGLEQATLWALAAGLFNTIPYFGPVIISGGLGIVALMQFGSVTQALWVAAGALAITSVEGWLIVPPLMGRAERMNVLAVFLGLLVWSWIWGVWGTILAVPMLAVIKAVADHVERFQPVGDLLGPLPERGKSRITKT